MAQPLMPKATAVWLVDHTALTFDQISDFSGLHSLEVQAIADGEVSPGMQGLDPIVNGQLTKEEIKRCETDPTARLELSLPTVPLPKSRQKGARYTPISKRQDRPDAIAWLLRNHPELSDAQISRLIGTTKPTINAVRDKTHRNTPNITPQSPIFLGLCSAPELEKIVIKARARNENFRSQTQGAQTLNDIPNENQMEDNEKDSPSSPANAFGMPELKSKESPPSPWSDVDTVDSSKKNEENP